MKRFYWVVLLMLFVGCQSDNVEEIVVELQSQSWDFASEQSPIFEQSDAAAELHFEGDIKSGFTISLTADFKPASVTASTTLLEIEGVVKLFTRQHDPNNWQQQNYPAFSLDDGTVPVVEAELVLQPDNGVGGGTLTVGVPLAMLQQPYGKHDVVLNFTGVAWTIYIDGRLYDNDFAIGYPALKKTQMVLRDVAVNDVEIYAPALQPVQVEEHNTVNNIQYWTPPFHNAWVGDVATIYHEGRYHVFYLFDRRGHASKLGRGGHYFEHISTEDFKTWVEHEPAVPIEYQWETLGTGTPFVTDGKLCLAYGLHSTRIYPREKTSLPMMWGYYEQNKKTEVFDYATHPEVIPAGSSYAVSEDGVAAFEKSRMLIHPCENPSIFNLKEGGLRMLANYGSRGEWSANSLQDGWVSENEDFPPGGDCTFYFEWGGYDYIIGGFNQLYSRRRGEGNDRWWSVVAEGRDIYNGMSVPAVSEIGDGRFLLAGWVKCQNWGGVLAIHELVQFPDGRLGSKWMEEITPATEPKESLSACENISVDEPSFMLTFDVEPSDRQMGRVGVTICGEQGYDHSCEWQLQLDRERAQFAGGVAAGFARDERTLREGGDLAAARNYAIAGGMRQSGATQVRMMVYWDKKLRGTVVDVEIAGQRTMISYRPELKPSQVEFRLDGVNIKNLRKANLK
ncbi:MAG: hypothetical protein IJ434_06130 [Alistipes sp.]|nr:hypothetical protein [Alistipes sp.]